MWLRAWVLAITVLLPMAASAASAADAISGTRLTDDGANNSDAALRDRPILGLQIVGGFKPTAAGGWDGGTVYSPRTGKRFPAELSLEADGRLQIKVKAGLLSRTVYWTR